MRKYLKFDKNMAFSLGFLSFIFAIMVPLPKTAIDLALVSIIALSAVPLLRVMSIKQWDEIATFPTILLASAIFKISLNVSTTRRILTDGDPGTVIEAFGKVVVGSNVFVGIVVFSVLTIVQFVLANGSIRTAEVAARFTLDSMPGKQLSIDSDLQQGLITQEQARDRRKKLEMEIDFYGNMDGAGKFIKGDVFISLALVFINVIFGLITGMAIKGMSLAEAASHYTLLTLGDGLVNQLSSLMITGASGFLLTRVYREGEKSAMGGIVADLAGDPKIIGLVGMIFIAIGILPLGFPKIPFFAIGGGILWFGYQKQKRKEKEEEERLLALPDEEQGGREAERPEEVSEVEPITLEVGFALVPVVGEEKEGETLKDKITLMRKKLAKQLGVKIPQIHVMDNASLPYTRYNVLIKDSVVASGELMLNHHLAMKTPYTVRNVDGIPTKDPIFGEDALWVTEKGAEDAKAAGYNVFDHLSVLSTHLDEMIRRNLHELLQRQEVQNLLDTLAEKHKVLLSEIDKKSIDLSTIQRVLRNLLREEISIRDLPTILEAIIDCKARDKIDDITSAVRERISKHICEKNRNARDGKMYVILLNQQLERNGKTKSKNDEYYLELDVEEERRVLQAVIGEVEKAQMAEIEPLVLTSRTDLRCALARLFHKYSVPVPVMSTNELVPGIPIERIGVIDNANES